jgi:hypothetical protein
MQALEQHVADALAKATRKPDLQRLEPLLERMEVLEEQLQVGKTSNSSWCRSAIIAILAGATPD